MLGYLWLNCDQDFGFPRSIQVVECLVLGYLWLNCDQEISETSFYSGATLDFIQRNAKEK